MSFEAYHLLFYAAFVPILLVAFLILWGLKKHYPEKQTFRFVVIEVVLISTRILLLVFDLGSFPQITLDPVFYFFAMIIGFIFMYIYIRYIENIKIIELQWKKTSISLQVIIGVLATILMLGIAIGLLVLLADYQISTEIFKSVDQILTALFFAIGAIYEEWFYRGLLFSYERWNSIQKVAISATLFFIIHIGYLPFTGFGVYYILMFLTSVTLGYLAYEFGIVASSTFHCLFVLLSVMSV